MSAYDGNAIAGLMHTAFGQDMTAASGTCAGCGIPSWLGQAPVYRGAGVLLRCPHCDAVMLVIIENGDVLAVDVHGLAELRHTTT
ncbi:DUF6510 family protein [Pseudonocardia alaniniphila]|uniref:DUF6510 family protein n=1 Tax=Pseudonocardia alaniniphila TaxID=75291 RepID=A0ABS9TQU4_9PSEU|nr:DUF6510 family protein [Pseudonocardia alaniniphila]MCH6170914.1 DUF6510 family protein [Pseudonocardia alaniniphila]